MVSLTCFSIVLRSSLEMIFSVAVTASSIVRVGLTNHEPLRLITAKPIAGRLPVFVDDWLRLFSIDFASTGTPKSSSSFAMSLPQRFFVSVSSVSVTQRPAYVARKTGASGSVSAKLTPVVTIVTVALSPFCFVASLRPGNESSYLPFAGLTPSSACPMN